MIASLLAGLTVLLGLSVPMMGGRFYWGRDLTLIDLGYSCAFQRQWALGLGLEVSTFIGNGLPSSLEPMSILFYPLRWPWVWLEPDWATSLVQVTHLAIGAGATTWLLRTFRCSASSAAAGGVAFALSGTCLDLIVHSCYIVSAAWVPMAWASTRSLLWSSGYEGSPRWPGAILVLSCLGLLFGGDPQGFGISAAIVVLESVISRRFRMGSIALVLVAGAFCIGLLQWLGSLDELTLGFRGTGMNADEVLSWSLSRDYWAGLILPGWSSLPADPGVTPRSLWFEPQHPNHFDLIEWNRVPYLGALVLATLVPAASVRRARAPLLVFVVGLMLSFGKDGLILPPLVEWVPPIGTFRYPAKYMLVSTLAAVAVAIIVSDRVRRSARLKRLVLISALATLSGLGALGLFVSFGAGAIDELVRIHRPGGPSEHPPLSLWLMGELGRSALPLVILVAVLALGFARRAERWVAWALVLDYGLLFPLATTQTEPIASMKSPLATLAGSSIPVLCKSPRLESARIFADVNPAQQMRLLMSGQLGACDGFASANPYSPFTPRTISTLRAELEAGSAAVARALGCTHYLIERPISRGVRFVPVPFAESEREGPFWVYAIEGAMPQVFVAKHPRMSHSETEALDAVRSSTSSEMTLAIVDDPSARITQRVLPSGDGVNVLEVDWTERHKARVQLAGSGGAVMSLRTIYMRGWRATQAGTELPVVRIAATQVAAVVEDVARGPIELEYVMPRRALRISAAALGMGLVALAMSRLTRAGFRDSR